MARPGARFAFSLWCSLDDNPYFAALSLGLAQLSPDAPNGLLAAFALSDPADLRRLLERAAFPETAIFVHAVELELPALERFIPRHLASTPMARLFEEAPAADRERVVATTSELLSSSGAALRAPFRSWFATGRL